MKTNRLRNKPVVSLSYCCWLKSQGRGIQCSYVPRSRIYIYILYQDTGPRFPVGVCTWSSPRCYGVYHPDSIATSSVLVRKNVMMMLNMNWKTHAVVRSSKDTPNSASSSFRSTTIAMHTMPVRVHACIHVEASINTTHWLLMCVCRGCNQRVAVKADDLQSRRERCVYVYACLRVSVCLQTRAHDSLS